MVVWARTKMAESRLQAMKWTATVHGRRRSTVDGFGEDLRAIGRSLIVEVFGHEVTQWIRRESNRALERPGHLDD